MSIDLDAIVALDVHTHAERNVGEPQDPVTPDRWLSDFEKLPIRDEVRPLVLKHNAARLLGLERPSERA
jgi:hypothetical protein